MRSQISRCILMVSHAGCLIALAACNSSAPGTHTTTKVLSTVSVAPTTATLFNGPAGSSCAVGSQQLTATAHYSDGTTADVTSSATWSTSDSTVVLVSTSGLASAAGGKAGNATITATLTNVPGTATVAASYISQASMTPLNPAMAATAGTTKQFSLAGTLTNANAANSQQDFTASAAWSVANGTTSGSSNANTVASVGTTTGLASPVAAGNTQVIASVCGLTAQTNVYVESSGAIAISTTPAATMSTGSTQTLTASELYVDGSNNPLEAAVVWSSSSSNVQLTPIGPNNSSVIVTALKNSAAAAAAKAARATADVKAKPELTVIGGPITITATSTLPSGPVVTGSTSFSLGAAVNRFLFFSNDGEGTTSTYAYNGNVLTPTAKSLISSGSGGSGLLIHPSGKFAYIFGFLAGPGGGEVIATYNFNSVTGALAPTSPLQEVALPPISNLSSAPKGVIDPTGQFLYVVCNGISQLGQYNINPLTGALAPIAGTAPSFDQPNDIIMDLAGGRLYVVDISGILSSFTIGAGGVLAPASPATLQLYSPANSEYWQGTLDPTGAYLYLVDNQNVEVVNTGTLTRVGSSPYFISQGGNNGNYNDLAAAVVDPSASFLYLLSVETNAFPYAAYCPTPTGSILTIALSPDASLTATPPESSPSEIDPMSTVSAGSHPYAASLDTSGTELLVNAACSNAFSVFSLAKGIPTLTSTTETGAQAFYGNFGFSVYSAPASPTLAPAELLATNSASGKLAAFQVGSGGVLAPDSVSPITSDISSATSIAAASTSNLVFTANGPSGASDLGAYQYNPSGSPNTLTPLPGSPFNATTPVASLTLDLTGQFGYGISKSTSSVLSIDFNSATGSLITPLGTSTGLTNLHTLVSDPQGTYLYALQQNAISQLYGLCNSDCVNTTITFTGDWESGAVSADGAYLVVLDPTANSLAVVSTIQGTIVSSLPLTGSPRYVIFDPQGRYVLVADPVTNKISAYSFSPSATPQLASVGSPLTLPSTGGAIGTPVFDATGAYLFVPQLGNPTSNPATPGSIAVYAVSVTGQTPSFTSVTGSPFPAGSSNTGLGTSGLAVINSVN